MVSTHTDDCCTRAISFATGIPYTTVRKKLLYTSMLYGCPKLYVSCYRHYIEDVLGLPSVETYGMTVGEFADAHPIGTYILRGNGHVVAIRDNTCFDLFDSRDMKLTHAWKVD